MTMITSCCIIVDGCIKRNSLQLVVQTLGQLYLVAALIALYYTDGCWLFFEKHQSFDHQALEFNPQQTEILSLAGAGRLQPVPSSTLYQATGDAGIVPEIVPAPDAPVVCGRCPYRTNYSGRRGARPRGQPTSAPGYSRVTSARPPPGTVPARAVTRDLCPLGCVTMAWSHVVGMYVAKGDTSTTTASIATGSSPTTAGSHTARPPVLYCAVPQPASSSSRLHHRRYSSVLWDTYRTPVLTGEKTPPTSAAGVQGRTQL
ncbi:hypothetical protein CBL_10955 [Carabus blaptoides fortunei]